MDERSRERRKVSRAFVMVLQVGVSMMAPMLLCGILGYYLDRLLHTGYWFIILLVLGILSAFRSVYLMLRRFYRKDLEEEAEKLRYMEELKTFSKAHPPEDIEDLRVRRQRERE